MVQSEFENLKIIVEKQIIAVIDFLLLDMQIKSNEIHDISKFVLNTIDKTKSKKDLYKSFSKLLSDFPVLSNYLSETSKSLAKYSNA